MQQKWGWGGHLKPYLRPCLLFLVVDRLVKRKIFCQVLFLFVTPLVRFNSLPIRINRTRIEESSVGQEDTGSDNNLIITWKRFYYFSPLLKNRDVLQSVSSLEGFPITSSIDREWEFLPMATQITKETRKRILSSLSTLNIFKLYWQSKGSILYQTILILRCMWEISKLSWMASG